MSAGRWLDLIAVEVLHVFCRIVQSTMDFIVLGEAATKVMDQHPAFAEQHRHIPWRNMRGMRNRVAFILGFCCPVATVLVAACAYHLSARGTFHYALFKNPIRVS
mgnify:FL=1